MESRAKLFGHPVHPMLIVFPVGLFVAAVICDIVYLINGNSVLSAVAFFDITGGVLGGLAAAIFGFRDYLAIPMETRAKHIGLLHGAGNLVVTLLFAVSWLLRLNAVNHIPSALALICSFVGIALTGMTAWMGGELVDRLGVGVDPGANLDAPNSLSGQAPQPAHFDAVPVTGDHEEIDEP
jgi:uncharacterized membrane protein